MRQIVVSLSAIFLASCAVQSFSGPGRVVGQLENSALTEASGFARSGQADDRYWLLNDRGNAPLLYALTRNGKHLARLRPIVAKVSDWEDLDAARIDGQYYLVIADIGDNAGARETIALHLVAEPTELADSADAIDVPVWQTLRFRYPDGARDAESLAIDGDHFYVLSKRTRPAVLYRGSLRASELTTLEKLGPVNSLPVPDAAEIAAAPVTGVYAWQPTAMTFSHDQAHAVILTTRNAYFYTRVPGATWIDTLNSEPRVFKLSEALDAEAVTFDTAPQFLTTTEKQHAAIYEFSP